MEEYGECEYCLLCKDQFTDHPKGTAFVKFKEKECADKLVKDSFGVSCIGFYLFSWKFCGFKYRISNINTHDVCLKHFGSNVNKDLIFF